MQNWQECSGGVTAAKGFKACGVHAGIKTRSLDMALLVSDPLKTGRVMVKDENICLHCGMCAERCPTSAWDMQKFTLHSAQAGMEVPRA